MKSTSSSPSQMQRAFADKKQREPKSLRQCAIIIEKTLDAFGIVARIVEINILPDSILFSIEIAVGTNSDRLLKHKKDLAMAVGSPTGEIHIKIPVPGTSTIGIYIPRWKTVKLPKSHPRKTSQIHPFRKVVGSYLLHISEVFFNLSAAVGCGE